MAEQAAGHGQAQRQAAPASSEGGPAPTTNADAPSPAPAESEPMDAVRSAKAARGSAEPLPVTVLSGFLGAGKTSTLKHILENREGGLKVAVIVNDMAELNVDAALIKEQGELVQADEKMVEMQNGCICCTLREDLFVELAKLAMQPGGIDHILIESSGISEPLPVAETFTFRDKTGTSLGDVVRLDTLVTVVDGSSFLDELYAADVLKSRGWQTSEKDERTVAQLFCDQLEFANVIVMNKMDLMDDTGRQRLRTIIKKFNPTAELIEATWGCVEPQRMLGTGLFELSRAEQHPDWLKEARVGEHIPETVEYGISSITFRSRRPFHQARFTKLAQIMETHAELVVQQPKLDTQQKECAAPSVPWLSEAGHKAALRVVRAKGLVWFASHWDLQSHWVKGHGSLAGHTFAVTWGDPWDASLLKQSVHFEVATALQEPCNNFQMALKACGFEYERIGSQFYIGKTRAIQCTVTESNILWATDGTVSQLEIKQFQQQVHAKMIGRAQKRHAENKSDRRKSSMSKDASQPAAKAQVEKPPHWEEPWGDRRIELVVIGQDMDHDAMKAALESCLVTDSELAAYTKLHTRTHPPWKKSSTEWPGPKPTDNLTAIALTSIADPPSAALYITHPHPDTRRKLPALTSMPRASLLPARYTAIGWFGRAAGTHGGREQTRCLGSTLPVLRSSRSILAASSATRAPRVSPSFHSCLARASAFTTSGSSSICWLARPVWLELSDRRVERSDLRLDLTDLLELRTDRCSRDSRSPGGLPDLEVGISCCQAPTRIRPVGV